MDNAIIGLPNYDDESEDEFEPRRPNKYRERRIITNPSDFFMRYRLTPRLVEVLLQIVGRHLKPKVPTNHALSETKKLLIFLRFVASNQFYYELEDTEG